MKEASSASSDGKGIQPLTFVDFSKPPWYPTTSDHEKSLKGHYDHLRSRNFDPEDYHLRGVSWAYARLRHILTGESLGLWGHIGGLNVQLENFLRILETGMLEGEEAMCKLDITERKEVERRSRQQYDAQDIMKFVIHGEERIFNDNTAQLVGLKSARQKKQKDKAVARKQDPGKRQRSPRRDPGGGSKNSNPRRKAKPGIHQSYYDPSCGSISVLYGEGSNEEVSFNPFIRVRTYEANSSVPSSHIRGPILVNCGCS